MKQKCRIYFILLFLFCITHHATWAIELKINDTREGNFYLDALNIVMANSGKEYKIIIDDREILSQARKAEEVNSGRLDVMYAGTSRQLEENLLPIRFPVMRGLIGNRVFIIHRRHQLKYNSVKSLNDLKKHTGIQGIGWGDTKVLEAAGLRQHTTVYDNIFLMINAGRPYYFPRGVTEVFTEVIYRKTKQPNLVVERNIVLVYPNAVFFFVSRANKELADIMTAGFINAYKDGSYTRFFYNHPKIDKAISQSNLNNKVKIKIPNPFLTSETAAIPKQYWHPD